MMTAKKKGKASIEIKTIFEGLSTKARSYKAIKRQVREAMHSYYPQQKSPVTLYEKIFIEVKAGGVKLPHNDALVITKMIAN